MEIKQSKSVPLFTTAGKIAQITGTSDPTPVNWFKAGKLPGVKIGHAILFPIAEVAAILKVNPEVLQ